MRQILSLTLAALLLVLSGCGEVLGEVTEISISPTSVTLAPGQTQKFQGSQVVKLAGSTSIDAIADSFTWAVDEGDGGTLQKTTTDTVSYTYTAPSAAGVYHVVVTSKRNVTKNARATITVQ